MSPVADQWLVSVLLHVKSTLLVHSAAVCLPLLDKPGLTGLGCCLNCLSEGYGIALCSRELAPSSPSLFLRGTSQTSCCYAAGSQHQCPSLDPVALWLHPLICISAASSV